MRKADVIIPTFKPGDKLEKLLRRLLEQSVPVDRVIIMNTEEKYWDAERFESLFEGEDTKLTVCHIRQSEFDHGRTRHEGILKSDADVCICMTHDCVPYDRNLVKELLEALDASERVAAAYARQLPAADCGVIERYTRDFNYPAVSRLKGKEDEDELGIKTYFCSNVCIPAGYLSEAWRIYEENHFQRGYDFCRTRGGSRVSDCLRGGRAGHPFPQLYGDAAAAPEFRPRRIAGGSPRGVWVPSFGGRGNPSGEENSEMAGGKWLCASSAAACDGERKQICRVLAGKAL